MYVQKEQYTAIQEIKDSTISLSTLSLQAKTNNQSDWLRREEITQAFRMQFYSKESAHRVLLTIHTNNDMKSQATS